jgi:hypothetical protein
MRRTVLLSLLLLLALAPAARAEIVIVDTVTGAQRRVAHGEVWLQRWTDDSTAVLVQRADRKVVRVGVADGSVTRVPHLDRNDSIGPGGRSIRYKASRLDLRGPDGRPSGSFRLESREQPAFAWSADGSRVLVGAGGELAVLATATAAPVAHWSFDEPAFGDQPFAPDGSSVLVNDGPRLYRADLAAREGWELLRSGRDDARPQGWWSSAGRIIVDTGSRQVLLGSPALPAPLGKRAGFIGWAPDGATFGYSFGGGDYGCGETATGIGVASPGQAPRILLPLSEHVQWSTAWSPDGRKLAVSQETWPRATHHWPKRVARDYAMGSARGNAATRRVLQSAARALRHGAGRGETLARSGRRMNRVLRRFHIEDSMSNDLFAGELDC